MPQKISVIIPHKNTPGLLQRCLDSIPIKDTIEVVIVDDNSDLNIIEKENFPGIGRKYTKVIFTKEGKGAGYARNVGLEYATGNWLLFADSDDYFMPDSFNLFHKYTEKEYDIVFFNACSVMSDTSLISHRIDFYYNYFKIADLNLMRYTSNVPWAKLIRRIVVVNNNIQFDETRVANDAYFSCLIAVNAKKVFMDNNIVYCCTENINSLSIKKQTRKDRLTRMQVMQRCNILLNSNGKADYYNTGLKWYFGDGTFRDWLPLYLLIPYVYRFKKKALREIYWFIKTKYKI